VTCQSFNYELVEVPGSSVPILLATNIIFGRGGQADLKLDLYRPDDAAASPFPIVVFIHGGGWHGGDKESYRDPALRVASHGYLCASIDYRLSGEAPFPAPLEDCKCAVRWLRAYAADCGGDPEHIAAWGHSAGGHLAAMLALTPGRFEGDSGSPDFSSAIQCALCYSTPYDLAALEQHLGFALEQFLADGGTERASPMTYITPTAVPLLVGHGDQDDLVPVEQADRFVAAVRNVGAPIEYIRLHGVGHDLPQCRDDVLTSALRFLDRTLKRASA
jgi:acetyl esterase/lipase